MSATRQNRHAPSLLLQALFGLLFIGGPITYRANAARPARERGEHPAEADEGAVATGNGGENGQKKHNVAFVLRVIQPGLAGLMDGSVSTLAPIFAVAFATHRPFTTFLVGLATATGAGISMAFAEALSDDGSLTGRGNPVIRGAITGLMTFVGGFGHTLPFLVPDIHIALTIAYFVVAAELATIAWVRHRYFGTNVGLSIFQVIGSGALVFAAAYFLGNA